MYSPYIVTALVFGSILVRPERTFVSVFVGSSIFVTWYYFFHRLLHIMLYNLHFAFHHRHMITISRELELLFDFLFETVHVVYFPYLVQRMFNINLIPFSVMVFISLAFGLNHIVNYSFLPSKKHTAHHIFKTNSDPEYEDMIQQIPSLVQACIITHFAKAYFQWKD
jgi:hypothetical protein